MSAPKKLDPAADATKALREARDFAESVPVLLSGLSVNAPATCKAAYRVMGQIDAALALLEGK